ncbi:hypothetical protein [Arthrobacter sp. H41]|uniref:hypothetical protein n=1 Tax=Arthrobacter sp. H41 TaxID=1312978 RepID=UPI0004B19414|nr:hypothetical protein [Arthrobacter sp. H41]
MKNKTTSKTTSREFDEGVLAGILAARSWATPHVVAARGWATPHVDAAYGWAKPHWDKGVGTANPVIQDSVRKAASGISGGIATVTPLIQDRIDAVGPRISQVIDTTAPRIQGTLDKATPALVSAKGKVVDGYIPALSYKLGEAADSASRALADATVPPRVADAVIRVTGDKKAVKTIQKKWATATMQASKDLKKRQEDQQKRGSSKVWLILGIIAAAITAVAAAWRASKPVEDPWKTPAPVKAAPAPVSVEKSDEAKEVVADIKDAANRAASNNTTTPAAGTKANEAAEAVAKKAKDSTESAKHTEKNTEKPSNNAG